MAIHEGQTSHAERAKRGDRSKDAPATKCGLSPVAGASLLRTLGTHSRPSNPLQRPSPMREGHRAATL